MLETNSSQVDLSFKLRYFLFLKIFFGFSVCLLCFSFLFGYRVLGFSVLRVLRFRVFCEVREVSRERKDFRFLLLSCEIAGFARERLALGEIGRG